MAVREGRSPTRSEALVERVTALSETVSRDRASFDADGRVPDALFSELASLGLFRLWLPMTLGGVELSALGFMEVVEAAAALDGTIGWLVGNGGGMSRIGAFLPTESAEEIFADPKAFVVSATGAMGRAVRVAGGYRVTGRWPFGSGAPHATWFTPMCAVERDGHATEEVIFVSAPRADVVVHDNWHVSGLRATGSVDFELQDVMIDDRFVHAFQPEPTRPGVLYRLPTGSIFSWTVATVPLGMASGAIEAFVRIASSTKRRGDTVSLAEREIVQSQLGQVRARVSASRSYLRHTMSALLDATEAGGDLPDARVEFRLACTSASQAALADVGALTEMAGAISISESCPLERFERDARAAAKHVAMSPAAYIDGGKRLLGQDL
jgi:alkylation response protein AidB-like acyl-CoA dehydrogenase